MTASPSAIDLAWADPVFRVTGLAGRSRGDVRAFLQLSDAELDRIAAGSWRVPLRPAWQVAARIRNVADPRPEKLILVGVMVRSEAHTSELQSLIRPSSAIFCLTKKKN